MKLPEFLETKIVNLFLSRGGSLLQKGVTLAVAAGVSYLAQKLPGTEQYINETVLTGLVWLGLDWLVGQLPASIITKYGTAIQKALNDAGADIKVDGRPLAQTAAATKEVTKA